MASDQYDNNLRPEKASILMHSLLVIIGVFQFSGVDSPLFARDVGNRFNSRRAINGRNSKLHFEIFNRRQSAKPLAHGGTGTGDGNKR